MSEKTAILSVGFRPDFVVLTIESPDIFEGKEPLVLGYSVESVDLLIDALRQAQQEVKNFYMLENSTVEDSNSSTGDANDS